MNAIDLANRLGELYAQRDALQLEQQRLVDAVITPEIKRQIADIETELSPAKDQVAALIVETEADLKAAVIIDGATATGEHIQAVYCKPRVTWDTTKIEGYAAAHPELMQFRREGLPSVSIKRK